MPGGGIKSIQCSHGGKTTTHHSSLEKLNKSSEYIDCSPHFNKPKMANGNDFLKPTDARPLPLSSVSGTTWNERIRHKSWREETTRGSRFNQGLSTEGMNAFRLNPAER